MVAKVSLDLNLEDLFGVKAHAVEDEILSKCAHIFNKTSRKFEEHAVAVSYIDKNFSRDYSICILSENKVKILGGIDFSVVSSSVAPVLIETIDNFYEEHIHL